MNTYDNFKASKRGGKTVMPDTNMNKSCCPMSFNVPPNMSNDSTYDCVRSRCAWWCEDAQKCVILVLAETQRKAVKK